MNIPSETLTMRPLQASDSAALLAGRNSPLVHPFLCGDHVITQAEHQGWINKRLISQQETPYYVVLHAGKPVAMVGLSHFDTEHQRAEWAFYRWSPDAPPGTGTAMLSVFLDELFLKRDLRKLCSQVIASNQPSQHLHRKLGFTQEGVLRDHIRKNGAPQDVIAYALFASDWKSKRDAFAADRAKISFTAS